MKEGIKVPTQLPFKQEKRLTNIACPEAEYCIHSTECNIVEQHMVTTSKNNDSQAKQAKD
jgi:hypothetical protein